LGGGVEGRGEFAQMVLDAVRRQGGTAEQAEQFRATSPPG
jgi:hypothetical protein